MKQKLCNWNGKEVLLVEVPDNAKGLSVWKATMSLRGYKKGDLFLGCISNTDVHKELIPPGTYRFAFASPLKPTEQEAGEWVNNYRPIHHLYAFCTEIMKMLTTISG